MLVGFLNPEPCTEHLDRDSQRGQVVEVVYNRLQLDRAIILHFTVVFVQL